MPKGDGWLPVLSRVQTSSASVNIAGADPDLSGLGRQASLSFEVSDHAWHERGLDPYLDARISGAAQFSGVGHNPADQGLLWTKLKARWPFYADAPVRYIRAYLVNGALTETKTTHFYLKEWDGPNKASHSFSCLGVLDFANKKTALAPKPSTGRIDLDMTVDATTITVTPTGAGAAYAASGLVYIGREIMAFDRAGDVFTVTRGQRGTTAATHSQGDTVQEVLTFRNASIGTFVHTLVEDYTDTPADYLSSTIKAANNAEVARWGASVRIYTDIVAPTPVANLLAEVSDLGCSVWGDDEARAINIKMNRPIDGEAVVSVNSRNIKDISQEDNDEKRLTQVLFCAKRNDVTKFSNDPADYAIKILTVDVDAYNDHGGKVRTRTICTRLLDQGDETTVSIAGTRLLRRFRVSPKAITIKLDASMGAIGLTDAIECTHADLADGDGLAKPTLVQVTQKREPTPYHDVELLCQLFQFDGRFGFIMPDGSPVYGSATDEDKSTGAYILGDAEEAFPDGAEPYRII